MLWLTEIVNGRSTLEERERIEHWARQQRAETFHRLFAAAGRGVWSAARRLLAAYARQHRRRAAIRELGGLSDHVLKDIGLYRGDIRTVVDGLLEDRQTPQTAFRVDTPRQPAEDTPSVESSEIGNDWQRAA